jgi:nucleotide-binding universal stress UspA family protein
LKTILVPLDFSDISERVVEAASTMARAFNARLVLLHVSEPEPDFVGFEPGPMAMRAMVARDFRAEHARLDEVKATVTAAGVQALALHIQGALVETILEQAQRHGAEMIVVGSHGHGALHDLLVGGVTSGVLRRAACPVLVVPARR